MRRQLVPAIVLALATSAAAAQESAGFDFEEHALNGGGSPIGGKNLTSTRYRITLSALGDAVRTGELRSDRYQMSGGHVSAYGPPGEVADLEFIDRDTLAWSAERSAASYHLYRAGFDTLACSTYGACLDSGISGSSTDDGALPPPTTGYFYLVTAENRLGEEGTKGYRSDGAERQGSVCP
jgi:hypothetical protein